jgi:hypothetical protein
MERDKSPSEGRVTHLRTYYEGLSPPVIEGKTPSSSFSAVMRAPLPLGALAARVAAAHEEAAESMHGVAVVVPEPASPSTVSARESAMTSPSETGALLSNFSFASAVAAVAARPLVDPRSQSDSSAWLEAVRGLDTGGGAWTHHCPCTGGVGQQLGGHQHAALAHQRRGAAGCIAPAALATPRHHLWPLSATV